MTDGQFVEHHAAKVYPQLPEGKYVPMANDLALGAPGVTVAIYQIGAGLQVDLVGGAR